MKNTVMFVVLLLLLTFRAYSDKFRQDLQVAALKEKYDNQLRYIFIKDLNDTNRTWQKTKHIAMRDIEAQQEVLERGWRGYNMCKRNGEHNVIYGKRK